VILPRLWRSVAEFRRMPAVRIDLMHPATANNDPFYARLVADFHRRANRRHPKFPLLRRMTAGVAVCPLPPTFDAYLGRIEPAARRNVKKAVREGCTFRRIRFNDHLDGVRTVRQSAAVRQGRAVPDEYIRGDVRPTADPPSHSPLHDYPYFGVFHGDRLVAYSGCLVAGEVCLIEHILGHAAWLERNVVPLLIVETARHLYEHHPRVRFYAYDTYFGASDSLRRFKRKFGFLPHRVRWVLGAAAPQPEAAR